MRGDRPVTHIAKMNKKMATPHARGSTFGGWVIPESFRGYPACAGIDLRVWSFCD